MRNSIIPKYQVMPDLSEEDYQALKKDIQERGVMVPIEYDEDGNVLDGHHRLRICHELGVKDFPKIVRDGLSESEKRTHARQLNMARRHLTREQRQELIREQLIETPEKSNRQIAVDLGVDHKTIGTKRQELESRGEIPHLNTSTGVDGKEYPRQVQRREESKKEKPTTSYEFRTKQNVREAEEEQLDIEDMLDTEEPDESSQIAYTLPPAHDINARRERIQENLKKDLKRLDLSTKVYNEFKDIIRAINDFETTPERMDALYENCNGGVPAEEEIEDIEDSINKLKDIQMFYRFKKG